MENAKKSFYIEEKNKNLWNILLIDDAIWSWTTLNYVSENLIKNNNVDNIVWLAIVGSMRWFDIIKEI
jgi:predicted amidophosphoribosyltransferase